MLKSGLFYSTNEEAKELLTQAKNEGFAVFLIRNSKSKQEFIANARKAFPLDPPLESNDNWDALSDSLWGGLDGCGAGKIFILWSDSNSLYLGCQKSYSAIKDIFDNIILSTQSNHLSVKTFVVVFSSN